MISSWPFLTDLYLATHQDEEIIADGILSNKHVPRLVRADAHDVEDFDEFMRIAEAKQADAFQRLDFPSDGDTRFAPVRWTASTCTATTVTLSLPPPAFARAIQAVTKPPPGASARSSAPAPPHTEIVMEAIRAEQEAIMGHTFDEQCVRPDRWFRAHTAGDDVGCRARVRPLPW